MKVLKTVPQNNDIFSHEAPTAKVLIGLTWFFVAISAVSVTAAWNVFLEEALIPLGWWRWPALVVWGLIFVLPIEVMIFELSKYFWRSIIKGYHKGAHSGQFYTAAILLLFGLVYSGFMSQKATKAAMVNAAPKQAQVDTKEIDETYRQQVRDAGLEYSDNASAIDDRYASLEKAVSRKYDARLDSLQAEYAYWDKKSPSKYAYKLNTITRAMSAATSAKTKELAELATAKGGELADLQEAKGAAEKTAAEIRETNLGILKKTTTTGNEDVSQFAWIFSTLVSVVAALAVLFVFLLARFIELFYHRTGVERVVFAENEDVSGGVISDIIRFPFVYVTRHASAWIQERYAALPAPKPPLPPAPVYDPKGMTTPILNAASSPATSSASPAPAGPLAATPPAPPSLIPTPVPAPSPGIAGAAPPPPPPASGSGPSSFSLKGSTTSKVSATIPAEIEDIIKAAFKNPVKVSGYYEVIGFSPEDFSTAFDYLERLKKTARNCSVAANKPGGKEVTRKANARRLAFVQAELGRMSVGIVPGDAGPGSIKFTWLNAAERAEWVAKIQTSRIG